MRLTAAALALLALSPTAWGWGANGHKAVARIAQANLNPRAKAEIAKLLEENESIVSVASWADEVRPQRKETSTWHYINIPVWVEKGDWRPFCPDTGCIVRKVEDLILYLKSTDGDRTQRAEAVKFLVHFMGDMHQPMHCGDRKDRGGNDTPVVFFDKATNLHSIWDTPIIERLFASNPDLLGQLDARVAPEERQRLSTGWVSDWVWDGQVISGTVAYRCLTSPSPAVIGAAYQAQAEIAAWGQIRRAGIRLARVLNEIWPE